MKPIVTICPENYPGTTSVLRHFSVTDVVEHTSEVSPETIEGRDRVILGGWAGMYYEILRKIKTTGVPVSMFWTSSVGQTDFSNGGVEVSYLHLINDMVHSGLVDNVLCATPSVQNMFQQFIPEDKAILLPYAFNWQETEDFLIEDMPVGDNWVDLFCPADTRKNILVQSHGAKLAKAHIHYSGLSPKYRFFADLIKLKYTDMGWMNKSRYYKSVQTMKVGMQITYAETFDYVVAEHFALKRPCLISTVMGSWVDKRLWKDLMVYNIDDPYEVADVLENIISRDETETKDLNTRCYKFMKKEAKRRNKIASKVLGGMIG